MPSLNVEVGVRCIYYVVLVYAVVSYSAFQFLSFFPSEFKADDHALKQNSVVKAQTCQVLLYTAYLLTYLHT